MLILGILSQGPMHGYAIMREMEKRSEGYFNMTAALLYPTLHQMEQNGLLQGKWDESKGTRRRKVYEITQAGLERLAAGQADWRRFSEVGLTAECNTTGSDEHRRVDTLPATGCCVDHSNYACSDWMVDRSVDTYAPGISNLMREG